jgi:hypothetical protein
MFYLTQALSIFKKKTVLSIFFVILTFGVFFLSANFNQLQTIVNQKLPKIENELYIDTLVHGSVNLSSFKRKVGELPGVKAIGQISKTKTLKEVAKLQQELKLTDTEVKELSVMNGVHVTLTKEVSQSSINLIKEYMTRLTGKEKIIIGQVRKKIENEKIFDGLITNLKKWPMQILLSVMGIFWLISFFMMRREIITTAFLLESFQRRSNVAFKICATMCGSVLSVSAAISILFFIPNIYYVAVLLVAVGLLTLSLNGKKVWARI